METITSKFSFDFEHSKILENLPMYFLLAVLVIAFIPSVPQEIKGPIVLIGIVGAIPFMFVVDAIAQIEASKYIPLKTRIQPWRKEITFFCILPIGEIPNYYDEARGLWITPWKLGIKAYLPTIGWFNRIEVATRTPWAKRNLGGEAYVMFRGIEVKHPQVVQIEVWFDNPMFNTDMIEKIPRFKLVSGSEDFTLLNEVSPEDVIGAARRKGNNMLICAHCNNEIRPNGKLIIRCERCNRLNRMV